MLFYFAVGQVIGQEETINSSKDFYSTAEVQEVNITFLEDNWQYLLDTLRKNGNRWLIGNIEINGSKYKNVGVQVAESHAFQPGEKRNSLVVKLNMIDRIQNHQGYKTLHFSSAKRDPSMIREVLGFEIARSYFPSPKANYAKVNVNGSLYGLLVNIENVDNKFLEENFGESGGTLIKADPELYPDAPSTCKVNVYSSLVHEDDVRCYLFNYKLKSEYGWDELMKLTDILNNKMDNIADILNVDQTLWMLAFNNVLVNLSSYSGKISENFFLYQDKNGRFNPVIWDLNLAFGSFKNTGSGSDLNLQTSTRMSPLLHEKNLSKPLISKLLANPTYKKMYLSHIRSITHDWFVSGKYLERAEELQRLIQVPVSNDNNKFYNWDEFKGSLTATVGKKSKIPGIAELMKERARYLKKEKDISVFPPKFLSQEVQRRERLSNKEVKSFKILAEMSKYTKKVDVFYKFDGDAEFSQATMLDDGKNSDGKKGDGMFGVEIKPKNGKTSIEYYLRGENASLMSFDPPNYFFQLHKMSLGQLN